MRVVAILKKARDLILHRGWATGVLHKAGDGYCALGSIYRVSGVSDEKLTGKGSYNGKLSKETRLAVKTLQETIRTKRFAGRYGSQGVATFNDGSRKEKVIEAFDAAIERAE